MAWAGTHSFPAREVEILDAFAAHCAHGIERITARQVERAAAAATTRMAETLQMSLLTDPVQPDHLQIAVRYRPAAHDAKVGGDWYDAFLTVDGDLSLVIGDVAGHDRDAVAAMGQLRNLLRGISYALNKPPAALLTALDTAMGHFAVGTLATAIVAQVEQTVVDKVRDRRRIRWSNAGHLPPLLLHPDGTAELLHTTAEVLLGVRPGRCPGRPRDPTADRLDLAALHRRARRTSRRGPRRRPGTAGGGRRDPHRARPRNLLRRADQPPRRRRPGRHRAVGAAGPRPDTTTSTGSRTRTTPLTAGRCVSSRALRARGHDDPHSPATRRQVWLTVQAMRLVPRLPTSVQRRLFAPQGSPAAALDAVYLPAQL